MEKMPQFTKKDDGSVFWEHKFAKFEAAVYVPKANENLKAGVLNYGFISPYLLVFAPKKFSFEEAQAFAKENCLEEIAAKFATSVVFITPTADGWKNAAPDLFSEIISNSKIHEYYENGVVRNWNRFTKQIDGYYIRGAIFRTCLFGFGESADYIATNCLTHFEGDGLWGRADIAPVTCFLTGLSVMPKIDAADIPVVSYSNSAEINALFKEKCTYFVSRDIPDFEKDYFNFAKQFRRMVGKLEIDPDLEKDGLKIVPHVFTVKTSKDNCGDDKGTESHKIGTFAFYNEGLFDEEPVPLVLGFHGGGDSCFFFSIMAGWAKIAHRHNFLLVTVENHLNSTATEMVELVEQLKKIYNIDTTRIYASGFSMGGCKSWDLVQEYPELLAAVAPMDATFEVGDNSYGNHVEGGINTTVSVPTFYAGGEITPLPELPFQAQKCLDRAKYILELNKANAEYNVTLEEKDNWKNKIWGIDGDFVIKEYDETRDATLTMNLFKNANNRIFNVFASISGQGHDCREHTCEHAWRFMRTFYRDHEKKLHGGHVQQVLDTLKID